MVVAIDRCLSLLELLSGAPEGLSLGELAERIRMPKSATHRMLATLLEREYVTQDAASQAYRLSLRLVVVGFRYLDSSHLPGAAEEVLDRLARDTGEYCRLAVLEGERLTWVARAQGATQSLRYDADMAMEVALHATATGKAWLATLPDDEALRLVRAGGFRPPANAGKNVVRTAEELRAHLAETRRRGYASAVEEGEMGTVAIAAVFHAWDGDAAPVAGTVSIAGPLLRLGRERRDALAPRLKAAARELSEVWPLHKRRRTVGNHTVRTSRRARAA